MMSCATWKDMRPAENSMIFLPGMTSSQDPSGDPWQAYANAGEAEKAKDFYDSMLGRDLRGHRDDSGEHGLTTYYNILTYMGTHTHTYIYIYNYIYIIYVYIYIMI